MNNDKYDELIGKAIKNALEDDMESLDFYKDIKYIEPKIPNKSMIKRKRHYRFLAIAAAFLIIFVLSGTFAVLLSNGSVTATRFKIEQKLVTMKNLLSNSSEDQYKKSVDTDSIIMEINNEEEIKKGISFFPELYIPENIPQRFTFSNLTICKISNGTYTAGYVYKNANNEQLLISQQIVPKEGLSTNIINPTETFEVSDGTVYLFENPFGDGTNSSTYVSDTEIIDINGMITMNEIKSLFNIK